MTKEMLDHAENIFNDFCDDPPELDEIEMYLDPYTTEEKILRSNPPQQGLEPHEISRLAEQVLSKLPSFVNPGDSEVAFDVLYKLISEVTNG